MNYAYDLRTFFEFLLTEIESFVGKTLKDISVKDLEKITPQDIEIYLDYLTHFNDKYGTEHNNDERAKNRKLSCLRAFFKYYFKKEEICTNIMPKVDMPKLHDKPIVRLDQGEVVSLIETAHGGKNLVGRQQVFHEITNMRDTTIVIFFLSTGVRISELVGLNIGDIDMKNASFKITRKGGNSEVLFMPEELRVQMHHYLDYCYAEQAETATSITKIENTPLFNSLQKKRISTRAVQNLIKKYARIAAPLKNISPHKLRSTFGTNLYRATKDIYVVADVLGHKDVNTTKKHYAAISDDIRKNAADAVKLVPDNDDR
jgi:site-specific recombinase XerD